MLNSNEKAQPVVSFTDIKDDAYEMIKLLDLGTFPGAVALSHCQVSKTPFSFFVLEKRFRDFFGGRRIIINAKIIDQKNMVPFEERCLSFPHLQPQQTRRFLHIEAVWQFPNGTGEIHRRPTQEKYDGLPAMIIQHEVDHSNGENIYTKFRT